jgi:ABC-type nitrate/sulfonate/bicarbonate transport system substrate-binding protein
MGRFLAVLSLLALLVGIVGCGSSGSSKSGGRDHITVGVIPIVDVAPIYLGKQQGFFAKRGIDLPDARDQLTTRSDQRFAELRKHVYAQIQRAKRTRGREEQAPSHQPA